MNRYYSPAVYGPVESRRLGHSLGINLLPLSRKVCSFDCIYCECGRSGNNLHQITHPDGFLKPEELRQEIEKSFSWHAEAKTSIDYISFTGNGEPMLYPWFEEAVGIVLDMRDKYLPDIPTCVFTNTTLSHNPNIVRSLYKLNRRFMKLDAGDQETYMLIDRPSWDLSFETIVSNLAKLRDIEISTAVVGGIVSNIKSLKSETFVRVIQNINPLKVFIYAVDRPSTYSGIITVSQSTLCEIRDYLKSQLSTPITVLRSKKQRPSWFDESYAGLVCMTPPIVYSTEKENSESDSGKIWAHHTAEKGM
jgi:wyosine [tRNA(Phe)-imidazoG37] synthetase (radical SAM superfamily)